MRPPILLLPALLTLVSCVTARSPSPMVPVSVDDPVAFLNGRTPVREGICNVTEGGKKKNLPCVVYAADRAGLAAYVAVRSEKGILLWISAIFRDGSQRVLWARPSERIMRADLVLA